MISLLKTLTELRGVSGNEKQVRDYIISQIKDYCDEIKVDNMGNLIAFKKGKTDKNLILSAHMDEVGFIVTKITDDGYLKFAAVGGIDTKILPSSRVTNGEISGVISFKATHLTSKEEREKKYSTDALYIDIGAKDKDTARKYVMEGDYFSFVSEYREFGRKIKAKALDDRAGCKILIEALKKDNTPNLYCLFNVQEEAGLRGAKISAFGIEASEAIVIEATTCSDMTGTHENLQVTVQGNGPAISIIDSASTADKELSEKIIACAEKNNIKWQYKKSNRGGNDGGSIYISNGGIKTVSVSVPTRYIHSPVCVMDKEDFENTEKLILKYIEEK